MPTSIHEQTLLATVLPGLESVAIDEITTKLPKASIVGVYRGRILFNTQPPFDHTTQLRSVDNIYMLIERFKVGPHKADLAQLCSTVAKIDLLPFAKWVSSSLDSPTFVVNASKKGKMTYSRFDAADAAAEGILRRHPRWVKGQLDEHQLEFRLDIDQQDALFSLRMTAADFRFRGKQRLFTKAALRPTVAHALVWCSTPEPTDSFLDPFCGSGTLVCERMHYPAARICGSDISEEAISAARENVPLPHHTQAAFQRWDARNLPVDAKSITKIVTNLPFGRQILPHDDLSGLYADVLQEFKRILADDGAVYAITDQTDTLARAIATTGFQHEALATLSLKGTLPQLFCLRHG